MIRPLKNAALMFGSITFLVMSFGGLVKMAVLLAHNHPGHFDWGLLGWMALIWISYLVNIVKWWVSCAEKRYAS
jgi:hypothetical protein